MDKNYLIADFGASGGRIVNGSFNGKAIKMEVIHRFENRPVIVGGTMYWDILRLFSELKTGIAAACKKYGRIESMALDTWGVDFGLIDNNGKLISNPIHYRSKIEDSFAVEAEKEFSKILSKKELFKITGWNLSFFSPAYFLYSLKLRDTAEFRAANKFLMTPDLLNYFLTGEIYSEFTIASNSGMLNWKTGDWEDGILGVLDTPENFFPEVIMSGKKIGNISRGLCSELEIEPFPVIAGAAHDSASAVAGIPAAGSDKNWAFVSMGTWFVPGIEVPAPVINNDVLKYDFTNWGGALEKWFFAKNLAGFWAIQQCRQKWIKDADRDISWGEIMDHVNKAKHFNSIVNIEDLAFAQVQADMPKVIANFCRDTGQQVPGNMGETAKCVYLSNALALKHYIGLIPKITGKSINTLHLVGGGTKNKLFCQWIADATGTGVIAGPVETTSAGNLLMQLIGTGEINDLEEGRRLVFESSDITYYDPGDKDAWNEAYGKYLKLL